ncbi:MAG: hypothetical protein ACI4V5_07635 [Prevotella sp.]
MRRLNRLETLVMAAGALAAVTGVMIYVVGRALWASWLYLAGALAFVAMQERQVYEGRNIIITRLRRIMTMGNLFLLLSAFMLAEDVAHVVYGFITSLWTGGYLFYANYIHNNWAIPLFVAVVIQLYTTMRISSELKREAKKT